MENKTWIIILSVILAVSIFFNISSSYTIGYIDMEWEDAYEKNDMEWCTIVNEDNYLINNLLDELSYHDEEYIDFPYMEDLDCFS